MSHVYYTGTPGDQFKHEGNVAGQVHEGMHEFTISRLRFKSPCVVKDAEGSHCLCTP